MNGSQVRHEQKLSQSFWTFGNEMSKYGIRGVEIDWFKSYLENRCQRTLRKGEKRSITRSRTKIFLFLGQKLQPRQNS